MSALPAAVLEAIGSRPSSFDQLLEVGVLAAPQLMGALRQAERAGQIRHVRGLYELTRTPIALGGIDSAAPAAAEDAQVDDEPAQPDPTADPKRQPEPAEPIVAKPVQQPQSTKITYSGRKKTQRGASSMAKQRLCKACDDTKDLEANFARNKSCPGGFENRCNACKAAGRYIKRAVVHAESKPRKGSAPARAATAAASIAPAIGADAEFFAPAQLQVQARLDGATVLIWQDDPAHPIKITQAQMASFLAWWQSKQTGRLTA